MRPTPVKLWLPLDRLTFDRRLQLRTELYDEHHVEQLCESHAAGNPFDPVEAVLEQKGRRETYWVFSGFNRGETYKRRGVGSVEVLVYPGTFADAEFYALSANAGHPLSRTPEDCRRAFDRVVDDPALLSRALAEFRGNGVLRAIAAACGLSHVAAWRYLADRGLRVDRATGLLVPTDPEPDAVTGNETVDDPGDVLRAVQRDVRAFGRRLSALPDSPAVARARGLLTQLAEACEDAAAELFERHAASSG